MNLPSPRRLLRSILWLDAAALVVCFGLALRYGILAGTYPLAFGLAWFLNRPGRRWRRHLLTVLIAAFAVVVVGSGLASWLGPPVDNATIAFLVIHAMVGAHWILLLLPPLIQHVRRGLAAPGRAQVSGQVALAVARLSFWPAIVGGTLAIGPLSLRTWHVWCLVPALAAMALHALLPRFRRVGFAGWVPPAIGLMLGASAFGLTYWLNTRLWWEPTPQATYAAMPPLAVAPARAATEGGHTVPAPLVGDSARCGDSACHPRVMEQWQHSAHHRSANVFYRKAVEIAVERHGWEAARLCASCHDPVALLTGYYATRPDALFGPSADQEGVSCLACHRLQITPDHVGSGSYRFDPPRFFVGPPMEGYSAHAMRPDHMADMLGESRYADPALCGECHSLELHGPDGLALLEQDTYGEWRRGPFGDQPGQPTQPGATRRPCVSCHMPKVEDPDRPGPREASHRFLGGNTHLAAVANDALQLDALVGFLKSADLELALAGRIEPATAPGSTPGLQLDVVIRSRGVGHGFPSGALDLNDAWVELEVRDGASRSIWRSGFDGPEGERAADSLALRRVFRDGEGRAILDHDILSAAGHLEDLTVPPGGRIERRLPVSVPADAQPPFELHGRLLHRGINRHFARLALGDGAPPLPVTTLAERTVPISAGGDGSAARIDEAAVAVERPL